MDDCRSRWRGGQDRSRNLFCHQQVVWPQSQIGHWLLSNTKLQPNKAEEVLEKDFSASQFKALHILKEEKILKMLCSIHL